MRYHRMVKRIAFAAAAGLCVACSSSDDPGDDRTLAVTAMTFNVLCWFCGDPAEYDPWEERLEHFRDLFARHDADLIGLQELSPKLTVPTDVEQILSVAPGYEAIFYADETGEFPDATILYRSPRFELVDRGDYWLSPTPDEPRSTGFANGAQFPRLVVWALLRDTKADREVYFATTHFDNNPPSQEKSAPLLMQRTAPWVATHPVIVTGDFNSQPHDPAYHTLTGSSGDAGLALVNTQSLAATWRVDTNQSPPPEYDLDGRIDHIFVAGDGAAWTSSEWVVDLTVYGSEHRYPSDHRAMIARLELE